MRSAAPEVGEEPLTTLRFRARTRADNASTVVPVRGLMKLEESAAERGLDGLWVSIRRPKMLAEAKVDVRNRGPAGPETLEAELVKDSDEIDGERMVGISDEGGTSWTLDLR